MTTAKTFFGGVPTGPDVRKLNQAFPDLKAGDVVLYEKVEAILGISRKISRWNSIREAWRQDLLENGLVLDCVPGEAYKIATNPEVFAKASDATKSVVRKLRRTANKIKAVKPDNEVEQQIANHSLRILYVTANFAVDQKRCLKALPVYQPQAMRQPPDGLHDEGGVKNDEQKPHSEATPGP